MYQKRKVDTVFSVLFSPERWRDALLPRPQRPRSRSFCGHGAEMFHEGVREEEQGKHPGGDTPSEGTSSPERRTRLSH